MRQLDGDHVHGTGIIARVFSAALGLSSLFVGCVDAGGSPRHALKPEPPADLTLTVDGTQSIRAEWPSVEGATRYTLYYAAGAAASKGAHDAEAETASASATIGGLIHGQSYAFALTATGPGGEGAEGTVKTILLDRAPAVPGPTIADGTIGVPPTLADLSWLSSDPDGDNLVFDIFLGKDVLPSSPTFGDVASDSQAVALDPLSTYVWKIVAKDGFGLEGDSGQLTFKVAPAAPVLRWTGRTSTTASLSWTAVGGSQGYTLYDGEEMLETYPSTSTSATVASLEAGSGHRFGLTADNLSFGNSQISNRVSMSTLSAAPANVHVSGANLAWNYGGGATNTTTHYIYFVIQRAETANGAYGVFLSFSIAPAAAFVSPGALSAGYYYRVAEGNWNGSEYALSSDLSASVHY